MTQNNVFTGTSPNDGTGDFIRDAFNKVNNNFADFYMLLVVNSSTMSTNTAVFANNIFPLTNNQLLGNTSNLWNLNANVISGLTVNIGSNITINTTTLFMGNSSVNSISNSSSKIYNSNSTSNIILSSAGISLSNTLTVNSTLLYIGNTISNSSLSSVVLFLGNSTVNTTVNSSAVNSSAGYFSSNTLNVGSSNTSANGFNIITNGFKINFGWVSSNSTVGSAVFNSAFTTNALIVVATSNTPGATFSPAVTAWTKTGATILTSSVLASNVYYYAIGF